MKKTWQLMHRSRPLGEIELGRFEVSFPTGDADGNSITVPDYLRVEAVVDGKRRVVFLRKITPRRANSNIIYVSSETATEIPDGTEVTVSTSSVESFRWYMLKNSASLRLALYGLILAVVGVVIGAVLTVAEAIGTDPGLPTVITLKVITAVMEIVGLGLVFWKGLLGAA